MFEEYIKSGIISAENLYYAVDPARAKMVDASYVLPGGNYDPRAQYAAERIGNAVFFDVESICDKESPLPHMLPSREDFERALSALGIKPDDFVVIYGQRDMIMGPARVWWMFRVFGHDNVAVLDGGLPEWKKSGFPVSAQEVPVVASSSYTAHNVRKALVADLEEVRQSSEKGFCPLLDARPPARFAGAQPEPRPGLRSGNIPGSVNLPASSMVDMETGCLRAKADLEQMFRSAGVAHDKPAQRVILTCGSGVTACMIALGLYHIGIQDAAVYDGSWAEWGQDGLDTKIATAV